MSRIIIISCCLIVGFLFFSMIFLCDHVVYGNEVRGVTKDTIKVGVILDMTGPGAPDCAFAVSAIRNYFRNVNDGGGVNGRKIKALVEDDRYTVPGALVAFKKLVFKDKVFHIIGPVSSHGARALLSRCIASKVTMIPGVAPKVLVEPFNKYVFACFSSYGDQAEVTVDYIMKEMKFKGPRIAIVYTDNPYGKGYRNAAIEYLKLYGVKPVDQEVLNPGAMDAATQVLGLKRAGATHVLAQTIETTIVALLRDMKKYRYTPYVFGNYAGCTEVAIQRVPGMAPYYFGNSPFSSWYEDRPGMVRLREITLKYHPGTERPYRPKTYTAGWALAIVTMEGLKRAGGDLNSETFVDALESLRNFDTGGVIAPITYTNTSHKPNRYATVYKADGKKVEFVRLGDWRKPLLK